MTHSDKKFQKLPNEIYERNLVELVAQVLKLKREDYDIVYSEGSSAGDNYIGVIYRAEIVHKSKISLSVILKIPPSGKIRRDEFFLHRSFVNEADFYENLFPLYRQYQEHKGISDGFDHIPLCYKTITDEPFEGLYFEDLKTSGYAVYSREKDLTKEHVLLVMKVLAKMHAVFFCMKEELPDLTDKYRKRNDYFIMRCERTGSLMDSWYESSKMQALEVINKCGNNELVQAVNRVLTKDITSLFKSCLDLELTEPYATLCHGDVQ